MFYRLYLKRKLQKNSSEYICIFIIIIIAAMLIVIPSVFLDSIRYGEKLHVEYLTDGYDAVLVGAKESDEAYFNEVEGIHCQYKSGNICITIDDNVDRDYTVNHISYIVNTNSLDIDVYSYDYKGDAPSELIFLIDVVCIVFTIIGMVTIYFAYNLVVERRRHEIAELIKLGICRKTLKTVLLLELFMLGIPALLIATILSASIVKAVIAAFFVKSDFYVWIVYNFSIRSMILLVIDSSVALVGSFELSWRKIVRGVSSEYYEEEKYDHRYINSGISQKHTSSNLFLTKVLLVREKKYSLPCNVITIVTVTIITFVVLLTGVLSTDYGDVDVTINANVANLFERGEEIENCFAELRFMPYFSAIDYETDYNGFVAELNSSKSIYKTYTIIDNIRYSHISLTVPDENESGHLDLYDALVPEGTNMTIFKDNKLNLKSINSLSHHDSDMPENYTINIVGTYKETAQHSDFLNVYVSEETFFAVTGFKPIKRVAYLKIDEKYDLNVVMDELRSTFKDNSLFSIVNNREIRNEQMNNDRVIMALMNVVNGIIMVSGAILIYVFATLETIKNKSVFKKMIRIGIDSRNLITPVVITALVKCTGTYITGIILSGGAALIISRVTSTRLSFNPYIIMIYFILFVVVALLYVMPAIIPVKKLIWQGGENDILKM